MYVALVAIEIVRTPGGIRDHVFDAGQHGGGIVDDEAVFGDQQSSGAQPLVAGRRVIGTQIDHKFSGVAREQGAVDERFQVGHVVTGKARDHVHGDLRMAEGGVAFLIEGIPDGAFEANGSSVEFLIEECELGVYRCASVFQLGSTAGAADTQGHALCGDDVEDGLRELLSREALADGRFDIGDVEIVLDVVFEGNIDGAEVAGGNRALAHVVLADRSGDRRSFIDYDEDLGGRLGESAGGGDRDRADCRQKPGEFHYL